MAKSSAAVVGACHIGPVIGGGSARRPRGQEKPTTFAVDRSIIRTRRLFAPRLLRGRIKPVEPERSAPCPTAVRAHQESPQLVVAAVVSRSDAAEREVGMGKIDPTRTSHDRVTVANEMIGVFHGPVVTGVGAAQQDRTTVMIAAMTQPLVRFFQTVYKCHALHRVVKVGA